MEHRRPLKKKLRSVLLAATWGAVLFAAFIIALFVAGDFWPQSFAEPGFYLRMVIYGYSQLAGIGGKPGSNFWATPPGFDLYCIVLSAFLGALLFAMVAAFWQFLLKNPYEK